MSKVNGIVEEKGNNITKAGVTWYLKIDNIRYGFYKTEPKCKQGDFVEFDASQNGNYWNAEAKTLRVMPGAQQPKVSAGIPATGKSTWVPDKDRQDSIIYQSARKDALEWVQILSAHGLIDVGKSKNNADKIKAMEVYLDNYTKRFFDDTHSLGHTPDKEYEAEPAEFNDELPL